MGKTVTCKICHICDNTGFEWPHDLDESLHKGFTIGTGKTMYWLMTWHGSGHVTVYRKDNDGDGLIRRWISGDTEITIHWK